jgi:hypothetical protein
MQLEQKATATATTSVEKEEPKTTRAELLCSVSFGVVDAVSEV